MISPSAIVSEDFATGFGMAYFVHFQQVVDDRPALCISQRLGELFSSCQ